MSFSISIEDNLKQVQRQLTRLERQSIPIATAKALTFTAERAQKALADTTRQVFKRPSRFTQNAFRKRSATVRNLESQVFLKDISAFRDHYLQVHIDGGRRPMRRSEKRLGFYFALSKSAARSSLTRGVISKILADVGEFGRYAGDAANTKIKAAGGKKRIKYFIRGNPGRRIVYEKFGRGGKQIRPILVEIREPRYRKRLPFDTIVRAQVRLHFNRLFTKQLAREVKRTTGVQLRVA